MSPAAADARVDAWIRTQPKDLQGIKWSYPTWVGNGNIAALAPGAGHVRLQFYKGTRLADPGGLLEGTGKELRHAKLRLAKDLRTPQLKALVRSAWRVDQEGRPGR